MRKPDNGFIDQFRERFGDLFLTCNHESGKGSNALVGSVLPTELLEPDFGQTRELADAPPVPRGFDIIVSLSPTVVPKKHKTSHDRNLPGSGAVFHNKAGDLHSPMIQWDQPMAQLLDESIHHDRPLSWADSGCFTPLALQRWPHGETVTHGDPGYNLRFPTHHSSTYIPIASPCHVNPAGNISPQTNPEFDTPTPLVKSTRDSSYRSDGKFRYNVILQTPTAMLRHIEAHHVTYLNKGQIYTLKVADTKPPVGNARFLVYKTSVRVSFEEQDQRSDPTASWTLWKQGRGLSEASTRQTELLAVEYRGDTQNSARGRGYCDIRLEKAYVDGFCITWTADPTSNVYECVVPLRFNFLSTDFSRSKGVKGVPVRLCAKTEVIHGEGEEVFTKEEYDSEICYCITKLFRDHGAERKLSNDVAHMKKKIEKLSKQIVSRELKLGSEVLGPSRECNLMNCGQLSHRPPKRKRTMKSRKDRTADDFRAELALTKELLSSARPVSVFEFRGGEKDDPDLHPISPLCIINSMMETEYTDNQHLEDTSSASMRSPTDLHVQPGRLHIPGDIQCPLGIPSAIPVAGLQSLTPAKLPFQAVACFYVQLNQSGKLFSSHHHAIYLVERTCSNLKEKLGEKLQVEPERVTRILWVNSKGLKVIVDDDVVEHLPEGQIMTADISEFTHTGATSSLKPSILIELVF